MRVAPRDREGFCVQISLAIKRKIVHIRLSFGKRNARLYAYVDLLATRKDMLYDCLSSGNKHLFRHVDPLVTKRNIV